MARVDERVVNLNREITQTKLETSSRLNRIDDKLDRIKVALDDLRVSFAVVDAKMKATDD